MTELRKRLRTNFLEGQLSQELDAAYTEMNGTNVSSMPVMDIGDDMYMAVTLNPSGANGLPPEIIWVIGHSLNSSIATILRGQAETIPTTYPAGTTWRHAITADDFEDVTVPGWVEDLHTPLGDGPEGDPVFNDSFRSEVIDPAWTIITPSGTTEWTHRRGLLSAYTVSNAGSDACAIVRPYTLQVGQCVETRVTTFLTNTNYVMAGPIVSNGDTVTDACVWLMPYSHTSVASKKLSLRAGTFDYIGNTQYSIDMGYGHASSLYLRVVRVDTDIWDSWYSSDGLSWYKYGNWSYSLTLPSHIGVAVSTWGSGQPAIATFDYVRVYNIV